MQNYWKPDEAFVGDCMPFYHNGVFHLYYLWDVGHHCHPRVGRYGGHQWAHRSSTDLVNWIDHPLALPLDFDGGERSNCTGSLLADGDRIYAYYALRSAAFEGERFRYAASTDGGIHFDRQPITVPDAPPESGDGNFRDPHVCRTPDGVYHLLLTGALRNPGSLIGGALYHYESSSPTRWDAPPTVMLRTLEPPECSEIFFWNDWWYLLYSVRARTYYRYAKRFGDWQIPEHPALGCARMQVFKTAAYHRNRRIAVGFLGTCEGGRCQYGGRAVFREILQKPDGTLEFSPVPELATARVVRRAGGCRIAGGGQLALERFERPDGNYVFRARGVRAAGDFGIILTRGDGGGAREMFFSPADGVISLDRGRSGRTGITELRAPFDLEFRRQDDVLEVAINRRIFTISSGDEVDDGEIRVYTVSGELSAEHIELLS